MLIVIVQFSPSILGRRIWVFGPDFVDCLALSWSPCEGCGDRNLMVARSKVV